LHHLAGQHQGTASTKDEQVFLSIETVVLTCFSSVSLRWHHLACQDEATAGRKYFLPE
jgi:hypothetical protein